MHNAAMRARTDVTIGRGGTTGKLYQRHEPVISRRILKTEAQPLRQPPAVAEAATISLDGPPTALIRWDICVH
jgi:hypothetical protein